MALRDSFGRVHNYLRVSLTDSCNMRCVYCMPVKSYRPVAAGKDMMNPGEIFQLVQLFARLGVSKVRLTGGEPLLRREFPEIISRLATLPVELHLSTNGLLLHHHFELLRKHNVRSLNISLDAPEPEMFQKMTGNKKWQVIRNNIKQAITMGFQVKINIVLLKNFSEKYLPEFIQWTKDDHVEVRFIEMMPFQDNDWNPSMVLSSSEALSIIQNLLPVQKLQDKRHSTVRSYHIPGFTGNFGFISTVTEPFCEDCNRLRLSAKGKLRNCLFSGEETDLLNALRNAEDPEPLIMQSLQGKKQALGGLNFNRREHGQSMISIGG